jgi:hypothetical protein
LGWQVVLHSPSIMASCCRVYTEHELPFVQPGGGIMEVEAHLAPPPALTS